MRVGVNSIQKFSGVHLALVRIPLTNTLGENKQFSLQNMFTLCPFNSAIILSFLSKFASLWHTLSGTLIKLLRSPAACMDPQFTVATQAWDGDPQQPEHRPLAQTKNDSFVTLALQLNSNSNSRIGIGIEIGGIFFEILENPGIGIRNRNWIFLLQHLLVNQPIPNFSRNRGGHNLSCHWLLMQQVCLKFCDLEHCPSVMWSQKVYGQVTFSPLSGQRD